MLNITSTNLDSLLARAQQHHAASEFPQAEVLYRQVLQIKPDHPIALNLLGTLALQVNRLDVAIDLIRRALLLRPDFPSAHCNLATALKAANQADAAILHYRLALELQPEFAQAQQNLDLTLAELHRPSPTLPDPTLASALNDIAAHAVKINPRDAARLYERSLVIHPDQPAIAHLLGTLYIKLKMSDVAVIFFRRAIKLNHRTAETYHGLATALHAQFEMRNALEACNTALQLDPHFADAQWTLTLIQAGIERFETAASNMRAALAADPDNEELKFQLAGLSIDPQIDAMPMHLVARTFNATAPKFDDLLVGSLQYCGPLNLFNAVVAATPGRAFDILDLGCGTGLCGAQFKPLAKSLVGVDLASAMVDRARQRNIYDELHVTDILTVLRTHTSHYDLITAADVFEFFGDLNDVFAAAAAALRPNGLFAFTVESTQQPRFTFDKKQFHFSHNLDYVLELAHLHNFQKVHVDDTPMRQETGRPVPTFNIVLQKSN